MKAKLADCEIISLELQSLQTNYSQFVDKAFDDIQEGLQNIMQENEAVLKDIQSQSRVGTLGSEMKGMKEARELDITRQQKLKEQYIANEAQNLQLLLTANTTSANRDQQLVALQESNKQIFEELSTLNESISARQEQIENYREITQNTTQQIGVESDKLKHRLVAVGEELVKVNEAIETRKEESKEKQKALSEKGDDNTQCINEAQDMQKTNVDNTNEDLKKSLQRSNTLRSCL